jgi:hypothetical protein
MLAANDNTRIDWQKWRMIAAFVLGELMMIGLGVWILENWNV